MKVLLLLLSLYIGSSSSANILAVFPFPGKSHFDIFEPLILELVSRGHQVTMISYYPQKTPLANLTEISLLELGPPLTGTLQFDKVMSLTPIATFSWLSVMGRKVCQDILTFQKVIDLLNSRQKFDLVIMEWFNADCFLTIPKILSAPYIAISSCNTFPIHNFRVGNPESLATLPNAFLALTNHMSFTERVQNVVTTLGMLIAGDRWHSPAERELVKQLLWEDFNLKEIAANLSLLLVNTHSSIHGVRPLVPGYVEIGGIHIKPAKPLKPELEKFLNESTYGVLLFSMGSMLKSSSFPTEKRQAFMDAFGELPVQVIMKWEEDSLPGKPDNVILSKWLPQRDVLAHRNVIGFMGHGGLLSTSEAVYCGVPMALIPMFGDQPNNVALLQATGAALRIDYATISKDTVLKTLKAILFDKSYQENAKVLSERFRDRPMSPLDTAVYWTEYVIRHKGAGHLRSAAVAMPWYQLWLLDVLLFMFTILAVTLFVFYWIIKRLLSVVLNKHSKQPHGKKD